MQHPTHRLVPCQEIQHRGRVRDMALHAQRQRLDPLQQMKRVRGREACAEIAQAFGAGAHDEGGRAELLGEIQAMIAAIWLGQGRELAGRIPIEMAAVDDRAANGDAVAANPFGQRIHDDIGAKLDGLAQIRRGERIVDQERQARFMGDFGGTRDIEHLQPRIADGLGDQEPRVGLDGGADAVQIARLDERGGNAETRQRMGQEIDRAAIERGGGHDVIARAKQRGDGEVQRGHAARRGNGANAMFERRKPLLQNGRGRI